MEEPVQEASEETEEEQAEEFVPEAPEEDETDENFMENAEVSIPVVTAEDEADAEPAEETAEEFVPETPDADEAEEYQAVSEEVSIPADDVEEPVQEVPEFIAEEEDEEPEPLTREEMGYDIVFNTTISCLITNAALTKSQANKLASILHDAYARAIKPVHGTLDGDTVFVLATGKQQVNFDAFAALATDVMQYAIIDGATSAESAYGIPAARDM